MDKQTTIAFVIIGAILIVWLYLNSPSKIQQPPKSSDTTAVVQNNNESKAADSLKENEEKAKLKKTVKEKSSKEESLNFGKYFTVDTAKGRYIKVETDEALILLSTKGANIRRYYLKKYNNWYSPHASKSENFIDSHVQLINYSDGGSYNLSFVSSDGKAINTGELKFETNANKPEYSVTGKDSLTLTFTYNVDENRAIKKIYTFYGDKYSLNSQIELIKMNNIISNNAYDLVWGNGIRFVEKNSVDEANSANASVFYGGEQVQVDASKEGEKVQKDFNGRVDWIGIRNKYFAAIISPKNPDEVDGAYIEGTRKEYPNHGVKEFYSARLVIPFNNTDFEKQNFTVFIGPVDYDLLKSYGHHLEAIVDFGSFLGLTFLVRPIAVYILLPLFTFLHNFIPNYGVVIIVFSLIIKFVLYPLTKSTYASMKKMQLLQPKIAELKEKYKDDSQKLNKETMKLYSTYGVNPAGGCLPLLLQMPIFIALWGLLRVAIELRQQPFIWWITDLSQPDVIFDLGFKFPLFGIQQISGLAVLMGVTTFVQQKMTVKDPKQQAMIYIMPVFLTLMFMSFPSGLNLYYFMFNLFTIAQQYYINHKHSDLELVPVKKGNQKKGFMAKMMEAAEQNAKAQQKKKK